MILALADDLSGAAEAGGVAHRFGLQAEVHTEFFPAETAGLIAVDCDSRNRPGQEAAGRVEKTIHQYASLPVKRVFKKVDSVLRGNVLAEVAVLLAKGRFDRVLLVPANPGLGRTILDGQYWIGAQPLDCTDFANDPEYPATTADVRKLLLERAPQELSRRLPVAVVPAGGELPERGVAMGEARTHSDLLAWANRVDAATVAAGSAEFLGAFLHALGHRQVADGSAAVTSGAGARTLFVCGSTSASSRQFCRACEAGGIPVLRMPPELFIVGRVDPILIKRWAVAAVASLQSHTRAVIAIDQPVQRDPRLPTLLTDRLGLAVEIVLSAAPVQNLLVEGGATAAALVRRFGWSRLTVLEEMAPGVVTTCVAQRPDLFLTMKPGSYRWPDRVYLR